MRAFLPSTVFLSLVCVTHAAAQVHSTVQRQYLIQPTEGEHLVFCSAPELSVTIKVDSVATGATRFAMGTAELAANDSNAGVHQGVDEVVFFLEGRGLAFVEDDTVAVRSGLTVYVPQGVWHGFINTTAAVMRFVWVVSPQGLAQDFRSVGLPPGSECPPDSGQ
jgi:mannose-6-phosphate isomerase-like protein (cupin superfamily)